MALSQYVGTLNLLCDESRLRLCALLRDREESVSALVRVTGISQSRVSTHLARLREAGFVRDRRDGQHTFYSLAPDALSGTAKLVLEGAEASGDPTLERDKRRLRELDAAHKGQLPEWFTGEMERHYSPGRTWHSLAEGLAALLRLGDVLDVGSGDGAAAAHLAPHCRSLTCVDANAAMVDAAARRLRRFPHAKAEAADVHALPYAAGSFDAVVLFHTLTYVERPQVVLDECSRVLKKGGRLVVLSLDHHEHRDITAAYGERHPGFSPRALRASLVRAHLDVVSSAVVSREAKKPHFQVVLAIAEKPSTPPAQKKKPRREPNA